jgi:hypothetical protein
MSKNKFIKTTLLNVDSAFRNLYPKNIYKSDGKILPNNPLTFTKNSGIVNINYPSHNLSAGDNIIVQNVVGISKTLINSFYLVNNFKYLIIVLDDNAIPLDYKNNTNELLVKIDMVGEQIEPNMINNIAFNGLFGVKKTLIANDIATNYLQTIYSFFNNVLGTSGSLSAFDPNYSNDIDVINHKCLFIELSIPYINTTTDYIKINQIIKVTYLHISGINLGYLNANYPINNSNYQSNHEIKNIVDQDNFQILLGYTACGDTRAGGNKIQIMKIINTIVGYPYADNYVITLKQSFNNVSSIELMSTEFPCVDLSVKKNTNDKLYWLNIEDGQTVYSVQLDEGFYTAVSLIDNLSKKINLVERIGSTQVVPLYNYFDISLSVESQNIIFNPYNLTKLPNSLSIRSEIINNEKYLILNINHPNNMVEPGDIIEIQLASLVTVSYIIESNTQIYAIDSSYINKPHTVYQINLKTQTYDIILGSNAEIKTIESSAEYSGGENIIVKSKTKVSFLFDRADTLGPILGFKNPGDTYSITDYKSMISNQDSYLNTNNLDAVGNDLTYTNKFFNISGNYNYFLMYLNDVEYIYSNNNLPSAFAKILLSGNPGDVLFNTFVTYLSSARVYSKNFPISTLGELNVKFLYPDGNKVNFRNINHSFTLKITEEQMQNDNTYLNSQIISVSEEFKRANLID